MNILIIGSGGREHALAWKIAQSPRAKKIYALPGSAGIGLVAQCVPGDPLDASSVIDACRKFAIDLAVVGPEAPLAAGLVDALKAAGIAAFGPTKSAARLESSKSFAKEFMSRHHIPTAPFAVFDDPARARAAALRAELPIVVKADGLAAGKGVRVCESRDEAIEAVQDFMVHKTMGDAGNRVVIEECLRGREASFMALCDGNSFKILPVSRDHKRLKDGDSGPNTGGMGAFAPLAVPPDTQRRIQREILDRVLEGLQAEGIPYCGVLYCGLMLTPHGPQVLEFNARFGDPETQVVLPLIRTDLLDLMESCLEGRLRACALETNPGSAVCVVLASEGYPESPQIHRLVFGFETAHAAYPEGLIFHAGTARAGNGWETTGGRVLDIVATAVTLDRARSAAYAIVDRICFDGMQYRRDIAAPAAPPLAPLPKPKQKPESSRKS